MEEPDLWLIGAISILLVGLGLFLYLRRFKQK
ncbi:LPXTG cell wall anchor domain-containing protein [Emticicia sp. C21]|nr:LPXTG cell wall anchor domain-containing protein [Emticicia sp. C21]